MAPSLLGSISSVETSNRPKISVLGAGPAGYALAVDLEIHGTDVLVYSHPSHQRYSKGVALKGGLRTRGMIESSVSPRVTLDIGEVVAFSDIIILTVPSTGQETIWHELNRFDLTAHTLIAIPGNLFSLMIGFPIDAACVLETNLSPYSCRLNHDELVVMGRKSLISISARRSGLNATVARRIHSILPMDLRWCHNVVEVCLSNINGVFHPLMVLMNAGWIESTKGEFFFYAQGLTPSVANAIMGVDRVRMEIGKAFGFPMKNVVESSNECYGHGFLGLVDLAQNSKPHRRLKAPVTIDTRNISEDVGDILVSWYGLAEKLDIDATPLLAVISLAGLASGKDFLSSGRNLVKLGLQDMTRSEVIATFRAPEHLPFESTDSHSFEHC